MFAQPRVRTHRHGVGDRAKQRKVARGVRVEPRSLKVTQAFADAGVRPGQPAVHVQALVLAVAWHAVDLASEPTARRTITLVPGRGAEAVPSPAG